MGSSCSCASAADQPKSIEENIFDILPRDPEGPDDIFKPLDVHFARSHTLANLLQLYPSRQLPPEVVGCIWRHYFEYFLVADEAQQQAQQQASAVVTPPSPGQHPAGQPVQPNSPSYSGVSPPHLADPSAAPPSDRADQSARQRILDRSPSFGNSSATASKIGNQHQLQQHPSSAGAPAASAAAPGAPGEEVENRSEIACMQRFLTDILRHDLACLKERYDEVLAASLAMPPDTGGGHDDASQRQGFAFNPAPVLASVKVDIKRLNNMPIDYLARVVLREMKGLGEDELPPPAHQRPRLSTSLHPTLNSPQHGLQQPPVPDTPVAGGSGSARSALHLFTPRIWPPPPVLLTQPVFAAHVDIAFRNLFDRYYRKGFWILFTLNVSHHARKVLLAAGDTQGLMMHSGSGGVGGGAVAGGGSGRSGGSTWSDRIGAAVAGVEQQPLVAVKMRKSSGSSHAGGLGGLAAMGGQQHPHSPPAGSTFGSPHFSPSSRAGTPTHGPVHAILNPLSAQQGSSSSRPGSSDATGSSSSPSASPSGRVGLNGSGSQGQGVALGLRVHRSSHSRSSVLAPILEPPPPPPPALPPSPQTSPHGSLPPIAAAMSLESPGGSNSGSGSSGKSSFKLPPLLVIRSDNAAAPLPSAQPLVVPLGNHSHTPPFPSVQSPASANATGAAAAPGHSNSNPPSPGDALALPPSLPSPSSGSFKRVRQPSTGGSLMPVQELV